MTILDLLAAGFKRYEPQPVLTHADSVYQKTIRDDKGIRYFVTVMHYEPTDDHAQAFAADIYYNEGCKWMPKVVVKIELYGSELATWTVEQLLDAADHLWLRLKPRYYEEF